MSGLNVATDERRDLGMRHAGGAAFAAFRVIALAGIPLSLGSPGATVSLGLTALFGLFLMFRGDALDADLRRVGQGFLACYLLLVAVDLINGGGLHNIETAFNYLPLLALAPYAHALRRLAIDRETLTRTIQATLLLALAISLYRAGALDENRVGGVNLIAIGYGFVVAVWVVFLFSLAIEKGREGALSFAIAALGVVPVLLTRSKIGIIIMVIGCAAVALLWAMRSGRWRLLAAGAALAAIPVALGIFFTSSHRFIRFWKDLAALVTEGETRTNSFGMRHELNVAGLRAFMDRPLVGHGFAERMDSTRANLTPGGPKVDGLGYIHNDYVTHMVAYGSFGLLFLAGCSFVIFRTMRNVGDEPGRRMGYALLLMMGAYMAADVVFNMDPVSGVVAVVLGLIVSGAAHRGTTPPAAR